MIKSFKILLFFLQIFCISFFIHAGPIDVKTAEQVASNFYYEKALQKQINIKYPVKLEHIYTRIHENKPMYYVFTPERNKGFIIISADDDVYPVLAYSFDGTYDQTKQCSNFENWMNGYVQQIDYVKKKSLKADENIKKEWQTYAVSYFHNETSKEKTTSVDPLLMSTWDQGTYYNFLCPEDPAGPDGHVWAGCVATAMAQVMYYYRYPNQGNGSYGYYSSYGYLSADFGNTTYKWEHMQNSINGKYNYDMALLQLHCGIAIDMNYSPEGSGAYMDDDAYAMKTYFGYSSSTQLYYRSNYNNTTWMNMLKENLNNKLPIQYAGFGEGGGHAFVCDGYQGTNFFHFNWGWSGAYNGYYYLDNLNPGYTFNDGQQAILNSYPAQNYPDYCNGLKTITSSYGTIEDGSGPLYNYKNNIDCRWLIAPEDAIDYIRLKFERLNTETYNDKVIIYDGESTSDSILGIFSGNTIPAEIVSTKKKVLIQFITDAANTSEGWLISFTTQPTKFCNSIVELTEPSGIITDGSGNFNYNNSTVCRWRIQPPDAVSIALHFNFFDLANDYDFLKIYDEEAGIALATFQGQNVPQSFSANTGKLLILFLTSPLNNAQGWEIFYESFQASVSEYNNAYISISPNPTTENIKIEAVLPHCNNVLIEIYNSIGQNVFSETVPTNNNLLQNNINLSKLSKGIYFLTLKSENFLHTQKIILR